MKKLFAVLMSIMMIACFMPTMAFADGTAGIEGISLSGQVELGNPNTELIKNGHTFTAATVGYQAQNALTVTVTKTAEVTGDITVALADQKKDNVAEENGEYFTLTNSGNLTFSGDGNNTATFTVTPADRLAAGTYTATVKLTQAASEETSTGKVTSFTVSFTVNRNTLQATDFTFKAPDPLEYDGNVKIAKVEAKGDAAGKVGEITYHYFNASNQKVEKVTDAGTYTVKIDVKESDTYKAATDLTGADENAWTFTIVKANQTAPEHLEGVKPESEGDQGKITGTTAAMEYKAESDFTGSDTGTKCTEGNTTVDAGKTYYVRLAGDNNHNPSTATEVKVPAYSAEKPPAETEIPDSVMSAITAYTGTYDGEEHNAIIVGEAAQGYTVKYKAKDATGSDFKADVPRVKNVADCKEITVEVSQEGYKTTTKDFTPTISKAQVTLAIEVASKVYDGTNKATVAAGTEPFLVGVVKQEAVTVDCSKMKFANAKAEEAKAINFDEVTLIGETNVLANYEFQKPTDVKATISKAPLTITGATIETKTYDGGTTATVSKVTFDGLVKVGESTEELTKDTDYTVEGTFASSNAGEKVDVTVTVKLSDSSETAKNYTLSKGTFDTKADIQKATVENETKAATSAKSGEKGLADLSGKILEDGKVGTITIEEGKDTWFTATPTVEQGILNFTLSEQATTNQTVKVTVPVTNVTNYNDYNIEVTITVSENSVLTVVAPKANTLTYNGKDQALVTAGEATSGEMQYSSTQDGTYSKDIPTGKNEGDYTVYYKVVKDGVDVSDDNAKGSVSVKIAKKPVTVQPESFTIKQGDTLPTLVLKYVGLLGEDELTVGKDYQPAFKYMQGENDVTGEPKEVGTYTIKWTNASAEKFTNTNYDVKVVDTATLTIEAKTPSASGGGSYYPYTPSTPSTPAAPGLDKTKTDSTTALNAAATANKYDAAEQAEVKKILDKANADIKNAKTEAEVKAIQEAAQAEIDKILTTEEKAIVAALDNVEKRDFATKSKVITRKGGKKVIRLTWTAPDGVDVDGYEIFRSTKKNSGFGKKPYFTTSNTSYTNTKDLKAGKTYYYKVRAFVVINGERVYTDYSLKANRKL